MDGTRRGDQRHPAQSCAALSHSPDLQGRDDWDRGAERGRPTGARGRRCTPRPWPRGAAGASERIEGTHGSRRSHPRGQRTLPPLRGTAALGGWGSIDLAGGTSMIRVLLAEDQAMVSGAISALLSREADIEVVVEVGRGDM